MSCVMHRTSPIQLSKSALSFFTLALRHPRAIGATLFVFSWFAIGPKT
jgi:hypothetical protein